MLWIPISIATDRISFIYYFYPTIGALCIGLGVGFNQLLDWVAFKVKKIRISVYAGLGVFFAAHITAVVILTPLVLRITNLFTNKS